MGDECGSLFFSALHFENVQLYRAFSASYCVSADIFSNNAVLRRNEHKLRDILVSDVMNESWWR